MKLALPDGVIQRLSAAAFTGENHRDDGCAGYSRRTLAASFNVIANAIIIFHQILPGYQLWGSAACAIPATTAHSDFSIHRRVLTRHARHESSTLNPQGYRLRTAFLHVNLAASQNRQI